jgi:hypothetical protein
MKKITIVLLSFAVACLALFTACKKSSDTAEAGLVAETTPANNSNNLNVLGPDFPLKVEITSTMPPQGVKIEITAKKESSADPAFFSSTNNSTAPQNNYTITNTPGGVTCVVTVTVTSLTKSNNVWMGSYRYSKK